MISTLGQGATLYILDKGNKSKKPELKIGVVESVSTPQPKNPIGSPIGYPYATGCTNPDTVVDVKVKAGEESLEFQKIPSNLSMATIGNIIICDSREEALTAVDNFYRNSKRMLDEREYHEAVVSACDGMFAQLNPAYAKDKERDTAIESLRNEMAVMQEDFRARLSELKTLLSVYGHPQQEPRREPSSSKK